MITIEIAKKSHRLAHPDEWHSWKNSSFDENGVDYSHTVWEYKGDSFDFVGWAKAHPEWVAKAEAEEVKLAKAAAEAEEVTLAKAKAAAEARKTASSLAKLAKEEAEKSVVGLDLSSATLNGKTVTFEEVLPFWHVHMVSVKEEHRQSAVKVLRAGSVRGYLVLGFVGERSATNPDKANISRGSVATIGGRVPNCWYYVGDGEFSLD